METITRQHGAVLVVSLIILLMMTLIGVSAASGVILGERITFASRDAKVALEVAESMLRKGESYIEGLSDTTDFGSVAWLHSAGSGPEDLFAEDTWTDSNSVEWDVPMRDPEGNSMKGRVYIELSGFTSDDSNAADVDLSVGTTQLSLDDIQVFKIVARGKSAGGAERVLTTFYGRAF